MMQYVSQHLVRKGHRAMRKITSFAVGAACVLASVTSVLAQPFPGDPPSSGFYSSFTVGTNPPPTDFAAAPILNDSNAAQVAAILAATPSSGGNPTVGRAVTIIDNIAPNGPAAQIFNQFRIHFVFCDFEDSTASNRTKTVADIVATSTRSATAFVGNFNSYKGISSDTTRPGSIVTIANSFQNTNSDPAFAGQKGSPNGKQMVNPAIYPGSPDYRNPANGNSNAPNIRSALFTLPVQRQGLSAQNTNGFANIPYVTRFNNYGNTGLNNADDFAQHDFEFKSPNLGDPTQGQLPGRGDFRSLIGHLRLRGAHTVNNFNYDESVVGYSDADERDDIRGGWEFRLQNGTAQGVVNGIFNRKNFAYANLQQFIGIGSTGGDGSNLFAGSSSIESVGAVWSGVYDKSGSNRRLAILMSNLADTVVQVDLPNSFIDGKPTQNPNGKMNQAQQRVDDYIMQAGQHRLLSYTLVNGVWRLDSDEIMYAYAGFLTDRTGTGVPEPTGLALLGVGALGLLARRRKAA